LIGRFAGGALVTAFRPERAAHYNPMATPWVNCEKKSKCALKGQLKSR